MGTLQPLASALGLGLLSGARLYATVFALGLLVRFDWIALPQAWHGLGVLADTRVLIVAGVACAIEFVADKIPWLDSAWDSVHTFIRPIGAALLSTSLFSNVQPVYQALLFLVAGGVAFSGHAVKASARLAVNHSPEPFSNLALSLSEDALSVGGVYLLVTHPWIMAAIALAFLALFAFFAPRFFRALRAEWATFGALLRKWTGTTRRPSLGDAERQWTREHWQGREPRRLLAAIATADLKGFRNRIGTLCFANRDAVFFCRRWGRFAALPIAPVESLEARKRLLSDELVVVAQGGMRKRFDLLAGQFQSVREEAERLSQAAAFPERGKRDPER